MKVEVRVIGGRNTGTVFDLTQPPTGEAHYVLCEDDALEFSVYTNEPYPDIHLALHEVFIAPTVSHSINSDGTAFEYIWKPKPLGFGYESFFHNFCGLAELLIVEKTQTSYESFDLNILQPLMPIEVLARKINADRIKSMLTFLARNDGRDLAALARITRKYSGFKDGEKTIAYTLDRVESYVKFLDEVLPRILRKPIVKLTQTNQYVPYTHQSNISEDTIINLLEAPDLLYPVIDIEESIIELDDQLYGVDSILETVIVEETNLYENQVVHGFVEVLITSVQNIQKRLSEIQIKSSTKQIIGYESLFNKLSEFNVKLNKPLIERCSIFLNSLYRMKYILEKKLKVKSVHLNEPHFSHKAKQNVFYQQLFKKMIEWLRFGTPDWSLQNELNSIQDLTKLFEYYLFCVTKEHVLNCTSYYGGGITESPIDGSNDSRFVFKFGDNFKAELFYEPDIFETDADDALLPEYRNTEAWKQSDRSTYQLRKDNSRTTKLFRYRRTPDVVLRLSKGDQDALLIVDAKYMQSSKAFNVAMPECVMKYIHGIHKEAGNTTTVGLMIVNPDEENFIRHFHHDKYSIFGDTPVTPAIMTTSIDVGQGHVFASPLQKSLFRLIELMAKSIDQIGLENARGDIEAIYSQFVDQNSDSLGTYIEAKPIEKLDEAIGSQVTLTRKAPNDSLPINSLVTNETIETEIVLEERVEPQEKLPLATETEQKGFSKKSKNKKEPSKQSEQSTPNTSKVVKVDAPDDFKDVLSNLTYQEELGYFNKTTVENDIKRVVSENSLNKRVVIFDEPVGLDQTLANYREGGRCLIDELTTQANIVFPHVPNEDMETVIDLYASIGESGIFQDDPGVTFTIKIIK